MYVAVYCNNVAVYSCNKALIANNFIKKYIFQSMKIYLSAYKNNWWSNNKNFNYTLLIINDNNYEKNSNISYYNYWKSYGNIFIKFSLNIYICVYMCIYIFFIP